MKKIVIEVETVWQVFRAAYYAVKHLRRNPMLKTSVQVAKGHEFIIKNQKTISVTVSKIDSSHYVDKPRYRYKGDFCLRKFNLR